MLRSYFRLGSRCISQPLDIYSPIAHRIFSNLCLQNVGLDQTECILFSLASLLHHSLVLLRLHLELLSRRDLPFCVVDNLLSVRPHSFQHIFASELLYVQAFVHVCAHRDVSKDREYDGVEDERGDVQPVQRFDFVVRQVFHPMPVVVANRHRLV